MFNEVLRDATVKVEVHIKPIYCQRNFFAWDYLPIYGTNKSATQTYANKVCPEMVGGKWALNAFKA